MESLKGLIVVYINHYPELGQDVSANVELMRQMNREVIEAVQQESGYRFMFVPSTKESCRVEKVDFNKPHPRYSPKSHYNVLADERRRAERERIRTERLTGGDKDKKELT